MAANLIGSSQRQSESPLGNKWRLDEVVNFIGNRKHLLWRAVDQDGFGLDGLVLSRRKTKAMQYST